MVEDSIATNRYSLKAGSSMAWSWCYRTCFENIRKLSWGILATPNCNFSGLRECIISKESNQ